MYMFLKPFCILQSPNKLEPDGDIPSYVMNQILSLDYTGFDSV